MKNKTHGGMGGALRWQPVILYLFTKHFTSFSTDISFNHGSLWERYSILVGQL